MGTLVIKYNTYILLPVKIMISHKIYSMFRFQIECTLFDIYVDEPNVFLSSGEVQNTTISIEFAKVKTFQGKLFLLVLYISYYYLFDVSFTYTIFLNLDKVQVQNCKLCTRIKYNVDFKEASKLKSR